MLQEHQKLFFRMYWICLIEQWYKMLQAIGAITIGYTIGNKIAHMLNISVEPYHANWTIMLSSVVGYLFVGAYLNYRFQDK
jgi:hypothetical protein